MFELDSTLAQHIVDRAMAILPHNINVMDAQGMIIGSGDPSRLHTRHEGAQLVLANRRVVEIDEQAAACLRGVRPGVNLPLLHAERLVGVLGITGAPEVVRPYAELVRMAAEMLMEQRQMQDERHWQRQRHEAWLRQLLDPGHGLGALAADAEHLGLAMHWPRQAVFLELPEHADPLPCQARLLAALGGRAEHWSAALGERLVFWCRPVAHADTLEHWLERADARGWGVARLCAGDPAHDLAELRASACAARDLLDYARSRLPGRRVVTLDGHRLASLLFSQRDSWQVRQLLAPLQRLLDHDPQGSLAATLESWCAHDGHAQACARRWGSIATACATDWSASLRSAGSISLAWSTASNCCWGCNCSFRAAGNGRINRFTVQSHKMFPFQRRLPLAVAQGVSGPDGAKMTRPWAPIPHP